MKMQPLDSEIYRKATIIISAEAGAAEIISSALCTIGHSPVCVLEEPAHSIFKRKIPSLKTVELSHVNSLSPSKDFALLGSSYLNTLERDALTILKQRKIPHASVFDQWINFDVRFGTPPSPNIPDEIWITDKYAFNEAIRVGFPASSLKMVHNYKFDEVKNFLSSNSKRDDSIPQNNRLLFLSEPLSQDARDRFGDEMFYGCNEKTILSDILSLPLPHEIRLRKHPADDSDAYSNILKNSSVHVSTLHNVLEDILWADTIVGLETIALVYGTLAHKKVISYIPSEKYDCHLPHKEIIKVKTLKELSDILLK